MSKPYTETEFATQITEDRNWRIREISDLKAAILLADAKARRVLLRALVTICYAHWEGYIRFAARKYLEHVALRKLPFKNLSPQFLKNYFLPRLSIAASTSLTVTERCRLVDEILSSHEKRFSRINDDLTNTKSNLNFDLFRDICTVCGISPDQFIDKSKFIDVILLKRRNAIAHGEETLVGLEDLDGLVEETIGLMRSFGDALENHVVLQTYRAA